MKTRWPKRGPYDGAKLTQRRPKYGNTKTEYNGQWYDSAWEAEVAKGLDLRRKAKDPKERVATVTRQVKVTISIGLQIYYIADFWVTYADGRTEIIEAKGFETEVWKIKRKLMAHFRPELPIRILKSNPK